MKYNTQVDIGNHFLDHAVQQLKAGKKFVLIDNIDYEASQRFSIYGVLLVPTMKNNIQDDIGNHFLDHAVQRLKAGKKFVLILDNIDWDVKVHNKRSNKQNTSVHAVATSIVYDHVRYGHLPNNGRQKSLADCQLRDLLKLTVKMTGTHEKGRISSLEKSCMSFSLHLRF